MPAAIDFVPIEKLDELTDVLRFAILIIDVESVLIHVAHDKRLAEPQVSDLMQITGKVVINHIGEDSHTSIAILAASLTPHP